MTLFSLSQQSIHSNPSGEKSSSCSAGMVRYALLRSSTQRCSSACCTLSNRCQSRLLSWFHSRHFSNERPLAVHDFVVRQRQDEILRVRIHHPEGQVVVMEAPVNRVLGEVAQRVVHPSHVPLH